MEARQNPPLWTLAGIAGCMLISCWLAPRAWRQPDFPRLPPRQPPSVAVQSEESDHGLAAEQVEVGRVASDEPAPFAGPAGEPAVLIDLLTPDESLPAREIARLQSVYADQIVAAPGLSAATISEIRLARRDAAGDPAPPPPEDRSVTAKRPSSGTTPESLGTWTNPKSLLSQLESLDQLDFARDWSRRAQAAVLRLVRFETLADHRVERELKTLDDLIAEAEGSLKSQAATREQQSALSRARYALKRRVMVWSSSNAIAFEAGQVKAAVPQTDWLPSLPAVTTELETLKRSDVWKDYVLLSEAKELARPGHMDLQTRRQTARRILDRLDSPYLSQRQREFFQQPPFPQYVAELKRLADEPVDLQTLLDRVERFEQTRSSEDARLLAETYRVLRWQDSEMGSRLGEKIESHYRNANVRVMLNEDFLNRLVPASGTREDPIEREMNGSLVSGHSRTTTQIGVVFAPHNARWQINVVARGTMQAETVAQSGPATFYGGGTSNFLARKFLLLDNRGFRVWDAEANTNSQSNLNHLTTEYDGMPLVGAMARSRARQAYEGRMPEIEQQMKEAISGRVRQQLDDQIYAQLVRMETRFKTHLLLPLFDLELNPQVIDMHTAKDRVVGRFRIAGDDQLAAHTPRQQTPDGGWVSFQVHESAVNNALVKLKLEGQQKDLRTLLLDLAGTLRFRDFESPEEVPEDLELTFADQNAVRVRFDTGRVTLTMRLAAMSRGAKTWENLTVFAHYRPESSHLTANFVRDGIIELESQDLGFRDQVSLRGIFTKMFSRSRSLTLISKGLRENPRLSDLDVSQFDVQDGWASLSISPRGDATHAARVGK